MKKLKMKNVLIGMVVFTALAAVLQLSACKQRIDKKDKGANLEKFAIRFSVEGDGGSLKAEVEGTEINSGAEVEKGKTVIFTAKEDSGFELERWTGASENPADKNKASLVVNGASEVKVKFETLNAVLISVPVSTDYVPGSDTAYPMPENEFYYKGVFIKDRNIKLSPYEIGQYEVTYALWVRVKEWAKKRGYTFANEGIEGSSGEKGAAPSENKKHPVTAISWRDCIVWCNAYTAMKNGNDTECVYLKSKDNAAVLKDATEKEGSEYVCDKAYFDKTKKGFRLPTEAEWEFAARWQGIETDSIDKTNAEKHGFIYLTKLNSTSGAKDKWDTEETDKTSWYLVNADAKTFPVGKKNPNALNLYDMSGNVWEWCFDWYGEVQAENVTDPQGLISSTKRSGRGGSVRSNAKGCIVGSRGGWYVFNISLGVGFRVARSL